jgi:hypothetical protein
MLFILIVGTLAVMAAVLGLSICRVAALSDCNSAGAVSEWVATGRLADPNFTSADSAGEQFVLFPASETSRKAG